MALTAEDTRVLEFLAEHRVATASHVQALLGCAPRTAERHLHVLADAGLAVRQRIFEGLPAACWITARGLACLEIPLPAPRLDLKGYRHDVGVAWVWLAAQNGAFGRLSGQVSERTMRSADRRGGGAGLGWSSAVMAGAGVAGAGVAGARIAGAGVAGAAGRYGIGVAGSGPRGGLALHYPDLLLETATGHRVAVELELTAKSPGRLDRIMLGYAADPHIDAVLYLCPPGALGPRVQAAARRAGISDRVHVQHLAPGSPAGAPAPSRVADRRASRRPPDRATVAEL